MAANLIIIPARGGSKGLPRKNILPLAGKPLICHTIDAARAVAPDADICVSTDDPEIAATVEKYGLPVPFIRPESLATDNAGTYGVLLHALDFYEAQGRSFDKIILLQCTSPFRTAQHIQEALKLYRPDIDMVVSVKETDANPYFNCFEPDTAGFLHHSKGNGQYARRQDCPPAYQYNGAIYIINPASLRRSPLSRFQKVIPYTMTPEDSLDIDIPLDYRLAQLIAGC